MKYFSTFSGIGGFELGIQNAYRSTNGRSEAYSPTPPGENRVRLQPKEGQETSAEDRRISERLADEFDQGPHCIGYSEIDPYAIKVYERNFEHENYGDITKIEAERLPDFDVLVGGFPCQAFSVAGKREGFNDTRGTLFFDIARILAEKRPGHLVLENVKGLLSHDKGQTFHTILRVLADLGYRVEWQVLNSSNMGVPQNRERIFIIGHLRDGCSRKVFPLGGTTGKNIKVVGYLNSPTWQKRNESIRRVYDPDGIAPTLPTGTGGGVMPKITNPKMRDNKMHDESPTITANTHKEPPVVARNDEERTRRLMPIECERLQAFPDNWTEGHSDTQRYKMCGNAVTVDVITHIFGNAPCLMD